MFWVLPTVKAGCRPGRVTVESGSDWINMGTQLIEMLTLAACISYIGLRFPFTGKDRIRCLVSSVGRVSDDCVRGQGFDPRLHQCNTQGLKKLLR